MLLNRVRRTSRGRAHARPLRDYAKADRLLLGPVELLRAADWDHVRAGGPRHVSPGTAQARGPLQGASECYRHTAWGSLEAQRRRRRRVSPVVPELRHKRTLQAGGDVAVLGSVFRADI